MRRVLSLSFLLCVLMVLPTVSFAADSHTLTVQTRVAEFAELRGVKETVDIPDFIGNEGPLTGEDGDWRLMKSGDFQFNVSSNFDASLTVSVDKPLTNGTSTILTKVDLWKLVKDSAAGWPWNWRLHCWDGGDSSAYASKATAMTSVDGVELTTYLLRVSSGLGDIHEQAAGEYTGTVTLTVSGSASID